MRYKLLIVGLIVGVIIGGSAGYWWGRAKSKADASATITTTAAPSYLPTAILAESPGATGVLASDNGQAFVDEVTGALADQIAYGLATAAATSRTVSTNLNESLVPRAIATSCTDVATTAVKNAVDSWLPHSVGSCAEIDANYTAKYTVHTVDLSLPFLGVIKVDLQIKSPSTMKWRDNNCNFKSLDYTLQPLTVYFKFVNVANTTSLSRLSKSEYDSWIVVQHMKLWCQGSLNGGAVIGDVTNCPRCNGHRSY